jgi:dTDP-4-dehydrorhamnose reductase
VILIIGSNGQLGRETQKQLTDKSREFIACDYPDVDITSLSSVEGLVEQVMPSTVINCAAYTNVDKAEEDRGNAYKVNALGPKYLAETCNARDIELIHISTDYVFSGVPIMETGLPRPYIETDACSPQTVYGSTKLEGEKFIHSSGEKWYILRTAWLYGDGNNFVRTMLKLAESNYEIRVVNDQIGSPTSAVDLAKAVCALIGTGEYGLYHATCEGQCSWYDFAKKIFNIRGIGARVIPVTSEAFPRPAKRPKWSVLENARLKSTGKNVFREWEDAIRDYLE